MSLLFCRFQVLAELKEYATEVDVDFVRKAVRAIGRCAIKVEVQKKKNLYDLYACHNNATREMICTQKKTQFKSLSDGNMFSCFASVWLLNS